MRDDISIDLPTVSPSKIEVERQLLAAILADSAVLDKTSELAAEDFFDETNAQIFDAMRTIYRENRLITRLSLSEAFHAFRQADGTDITTYVKAGAIDGEAFDAAEAAKILKDFSIRRAILRAADAMTEMATNYKAAVPAILSESMRVIDDLAAKSKPAGKTTWTMREAVTHAFEKMQSGEVPEMIRTGIRDLDLMTGCLRRGQYGILAGRPSMGKSALAICYGLGAARCGHGVAFFSLEMDQEQLTNRSITETAYHANNKVAYSNIMRGGLTYDQVQSLMRDAYGAADLPIIIDEQGDLSVSDIAMRARRYAQEFARQGKRLDLIIVDHMGKVAASGRYKGNKVQEVSEISHGLFGIAKAERAAVLALSQLNRAVEGRDNKRPMMSDLRDSGSLEQDADQVMFAYREAYYLERNKFDDGTPEEFERKAKLEEKRNVIEVGISKNRSGGMTGTCELFCDMASNFVGNLEANRG